MDNVKYLKIKSKFPEAIAHMVDNPNDVTMYFSNKYNPFYSDFSSKKNYLLNEITKSIELIDKLSNKNKCIAINQYIESKRRKLDLCLFCAYAHELESGETLFSYMPPINDSITSYVYKHRLNNYDKYKAIFEYYSLDLRKNSIFVKPYKSIKNLVNEKFGNAIIADDKCLIDKKLLKKLSYQIDKIPVTKESVCSKENGYTYYKKYYVGKYKNKPVLFSEIVRVKNKQNRKDKKELSYQLNVVLNGDIENNRILYRMDYNMENNHINKLLYDDLNTSNKSNETNSLLKENVRKCHVHMPTVKYNVVFPNYIHSCDAQVFDLEFKDLDNFLDFNRDMIKASKTDVLLSEQELCLKGDDAGLKKIKISDLLNHIVQNCSKGKIV